MFQHTAARRRLRGFRPVAAGPLRRFNTQPPEGGCACHVLPAPQACGFNTQPPEGGCIIESYKFCQDDVSTHSRPKAAAKSKEQTGVTAAVSTHSRPKAAAHTGGRVGANQLQFQHTAARRRLLRPPAVRPCRAGFNTQPPEGGCAYITPNVCTDAVSTHSRPKAAAKCLRVPVNPELVSTHSRPKAAAQNV